jgi:hypothetical protein
MLAYDYGVECPQGPHAPQRLGPSWTRKAAGVGENDLSAGVFCRASTLDSWQQFGKNSFLNERRGNITENKGPLWKTWQRSWNVHENKGT